MTRKLLPALALPLLLGACANYVPYSPQGSDTSAQLAEAAKADPDAVTCKRQPVTGSRFTEKICHTNATWALMQERSRDATDRAQERGRLGTPTN